MNSDPKADVLNIFLERVLRSDVAPNIVRVLHYGSTRRGDWHPESDIDVLIVATGDIQRVRERALDIAFELILERGERVEPVVYSPYQYRRSWGFPRQVREEGKEVFAVGEEEERRWEAADLVELAREYLVMAEHLDLPQHVRGVIDLAYNSAELCAKAWLLLVGAEVPRTHGGIVVRFSEQVVRSGRVPAELGRRLNRLLERRHRARYDPQATLLPHEAQEALELCGGLIRSLEGTW